jgi:hypothetical protein
VAHNTNLKGVTVQICVCTRTNLCCGRVVDRNKFVLPTNKLEWCYCTNLRVCTNKFVLWACGGQNKFVLITNKLEWCYCTNLRVCTNKVVRCSWDAISIVVNTAKWVKIKGKYLQLGKGIIAYAGNGEKSG